MNFIIFDLECDTVYSKKHGKFINEIIEVGAVRLDKKLNTTGTFHCMVKSQISKKLSKRISELTGITTDELKKDGVGFDEMLNSFMDWEAETDDNVFLSWSNSDIHMIVSNLGYFTKLRTVPFISKYVDLQAYTMKTLGITGSQISLTDACEKLSLSEEENSHHRALDDSKMCCDILRKVYNKRDFSNFIQDTSKGGFYERLFFKPYVIKNLKSPLLNKKDFNFRCPDCKKRSAQITRYKFSGHAFKAEFECPKCKKKFIGNVRVKKNFDTVSVSRYVSFPGEHIDGEREITTKKV